MAICSCGLPGPCCQPAVAGGIIYADLRSELSTHLALQILFTQSSPVPEPLLQAFPFQVHWGRWYCTRFLGPLCLFALHMGSGSSPPPVEFSSLYHFYKLSRSWLLGMCPRSCLLQPGLFIYSSVRDSLPRLFGAQGVPPLLVLVFIVVIAYYSVSPFFPWVGVGLSRGLCWSGPGLSVGVLCTA
jgi:hypothetical protein